MIRLLSIFFIFSSIFFLPSLNFETKLSMYDEDYIIKYWISLLYQELSYNQKIENHKQVIIVRIYNENNIYNIYEYEEIILYSA